jgi:hypothetical protein
LTEDLENTGRSWNPMVLVSGALAGACVTLAAITGDIGFQGDDWWILSRPYWHDYLSALLVYAKDSSRPVEGLYWISIFETFGFNRVAFHFFSLALLALDSVWLGICVRKAFPKNPGLAIYASFFAFVLPTIAPLSYLLHTDNSRVAVLLFWICVYLFQRWAERPESWSRLIPAGAAYFIGSLTYEGATFLIFTVPLWVWPVYLWSGGEPGLWRFATRLGPGVMTAFTLFVIVRFAVFSGGAVEQKSLLPDPWLFLKYIGVFGEYLRTPFVNPPGDLKSWLWGLLPAASALLIGLKYGNRVGERRPDRSQIVESPWYAVGLACATFMLGVFPYLLAGYDSIPGFTSQSRVYSSASFGFALLLAAFVSAPRKPALRVAAHVLAAVFILVQGALFAGLRVDWQEAARIRASICSGILKQAPNVKDGTRILLYNVQSYISNRAVVFQGVYGINDFIKMFYNNKTVEAYFLYPCEMANDPKGKSASASRDGVIPRGCVEGPIPSDKMLIFAKKGDKVELLDSIKADQELAAIHWGDLKEIKSNRDLILPGPPPAGGIGELCGK